MVDAVTPSDLHPVHVVTLSDGSTTLGFVPVDGRGNPDINGVKRTPIDTQAVKTYSGQSTYDSGQWPYITLAQQNWSGGRGKAAFDDDAARYADGYRVDTTKEGKLFLGPQEHYAKGYRNCNIYQYGTSTTVVNWVSLYSGGTTSVNVTITASATYAIDYCYIWLKKVGTPTGNITVTVTNNSTDVSQTYDASSLTTANVSEEIKFNWTGTANWTASSNYTLTVAYSGGSASSYVQVMCDASNDPYYRVYDADAFSRVVFFEYKRAMYCYTKPSSGNSALYINGDRGTADANTGALTTLEDATKTWVTNEWNGCIALITAGTGSKEEQPWRRITANDSNTLTVTPAWIITHDTTTEYVILKSDKWTQLASDLGGAVTDHVVDDDYIYFAFGDAVGMQRYQYYTAAGVWSARNEAELHGVRNITFLRNAEDGKLMVYGSFHNNAAFGTGILSGQVPPGWGDLIDILATAHDLNTPWTASANVTCTLSGTLILTIAAGFTTGLVAYRTITATDFTRYRRVGLLIYSSVATASGDLEFVYDEHAACATPNENIDLPALAAATWTWVNLSISGAAATTGIISIGLNLTADKGAQTIELVGGVYLMEEGLYETIVNLPLETRINRLLVYAGNVDDPVENPWIITETGVYELQTQNGNAIVPLPIGEMKNLRSEINGKAYCVNDVYLWFNLGRTIQRYYNRNLDNVGPDLDEGLPEARTGDPAFLLSYPGRVFLGIDAGIYSDPSGVGKSHHSSILVHRNSGWHEVYRTSLSDKRIYAGYFQNIPGSMTGRLWVSQDVDILWLPVSLDPLNDPDYTFTHEGHLETGYFYANMRQIDKQWRALTLFLEDISANTEYIEIDYKLDGATSWTAVSGAFDTAIEKINLSSATPPNVSGKRIKFRLRIYGRGSTYTPVLMAMVLDAYGVSPVKYRYSFSGILHDKAQRVNLEGQNELSLGAYSTVEAAATQLQTWIDAGKPLTYRDIHSPYDNKVVILDPIPLQPLKTNPLSQIEEHIYYIQASEI